MYAKVVATATATSTVIVAIVAIVVGVQKAMHRIAREADTKCEVYLLPWHVPFDAYHHEAPWPCTQKLSHKHNTQSSRVTCIDIVLQHSTPVIAPHALYHANASQVHRNVAACQQR